jgi:hypothetical protein
VGVSAFTGIYKRGVKTMGENFYPLPIYGTCIFSFLLLLATQAKTTLKIRVGFDAYFGN